MKSTYIVLLVSTLMLTAGCPRPDRIDLCNLTGVPVEIEGRQQSRTMAVGASLTIGRASPLWQVAKDPTKNFTWSFLKVRIEGRDYYYSMRLIRPQRWREPHYRADVMRAEIMPNRVIRITPVACISEDLAKETVEEWAELQPADKAPKEIVSTPLTPIRSVP